MVAQEVVFGLVTGSYIAVAAVGFTMVYGLVNMINFAHGEFMTLGAYFGVLAVGFLDVPVLVAIPPVMVVSAVVGWALAMAFFRPLHEAGPIPLLLTSIGLGLMLRHGIRLVAGPDRRFLDAASGATYRYAGVFVTQQHLIVIGMGVAAFVGIHLLLTRTKTGVAMRATADNESLAMVTGIDTARVRTVVWLVSSGLAGLAGYLLAIQTSAGPRVGFDSILLVITAAILGGAGSAYGAILGAYALGLTVSFTVAFMPAWATDLGTTFAFLVLIVVLLVRPGGIAGTEVHG